jgi:hypothetical protein
MPSVIISDDEETPARQETGTKRIKTQDSKLIVRSKMGRFKKN